MNEFKLVMISAGFEHGGNVTHRHLDGHPDLLVYPFESQLGNREFTDFLASVERVQYRYPEFPEGLSAEGLYESIIDEEMKTFLRKRNGSKFKNADLVMSEEDRKRKFVDLLGSKDRYLRSEVIKAFFISTFASWENSFVKPRKDSTYVGYSPAICLDAQRMIRDFPDIRIIHIIRNPFSAYFDTKRRPFPQPILKYLITWNIYHSTAEIFASLYPENFKILRFEDLVENKREFMEEVSNFIEVPFNESMMSPSWNGQELLGDIAPWGTVLRSSTEYNQEIISQLSEEERAIIASSTRALAKHFGYDEIRYLSDFY